MCTTYNLSYDLEIELEMVWQTSALGDGGGGGRAMAQLALHDGALARALVPDQRRRVRGCDIQKSAPTGSSIAVPGHVDANFGDHSFYYCGSRSGNALKPGAAIDAENARICAVLAEHNRKPKKRTWEDIVREKLLVEMKECFTA